MSYAQFVAQERWRRQALSGLAFLYRAGSPFPPGSAFSRADATTCATYVAAGGTVVTVPANVNRVSHYAYAPTMGLSYLSDLLEGAGTNSALGSCSWADATYWNNSAGFTIATATSCITGQTAYKHTANNQSRAQTVGTFVNGQKDCVYFILENVDAGSSIVRIFDSTAAGSLAQATFTWATHTAAITAGSGTTGQLNLGNGRWLVWLSATGTAAGTGANGNTRQAVLYPTVDGAATSCIVHHGQFEAAKAFPSSVVVTVASPVTRATDVCSTAMTAPPQALTMYLRGVELGTVLSTNYLAVLGGAAPCVRVYGSAGTFAADFFNGVSNVTASVGAGAVAYGDLFEARIVLSATGTLAISVTTNNGTENVGTATAPLALPAAWSATTFWLNSTAAGAANGFTALTHAAIILGPETSLATCRAMCGV